MNYQPDLISFALKMSSALLIVISGLLLVYYFSRRIFKQHTSGSGKRPINVLATHYIGVKKYISLVEIPGSILVLGITPNNMSLLTKIEGNENLEKFKPAEEVNIAPLFSEQLRKISAKFKVKHNEA